MIRVMVAVLVLAPATTLADIRLVGYTFTHAWTINALAPGSPTPRYETRFCDRQTLVWNDVTDMDDVRSGTQQYELTEIDPGILQVTWKESPETSNHGVVWTLNFATYAIYGVRVNVDPNTNHVLAGGFSFRRGIDAATPLAGCPPAMGRPQAGTVPQE